APLPELGPSPYVSLFSEGSSQTVPLLDRANLIASLQLVLFAYRVDYAATAESFPPARQESIVERHPAPPAERLPQRIVSRRWHSPLSSCRPLALGRFQALSSSGVRRRFPDFPWQAHRPSNLAGRSLRPIQRHSPAPKQLAFQVESERADQYHHSAPPVLWE